MEKRFWWERDDLCYVDGRLSFAGHDVSTLAQQTAGPLYLYSADRITANLQRLTRALEQTDYAVSISARPVSWTAR